MIDSRIPVYEVSQVLLQGFWQFASLEKPRRQLELEIDQFHNLSMSEETTRDMPDDRSLAERVLARLDSMDGHLQSIEARLESVEVQAERRSVETKPIWERALSEILELKERLALTEDLCRQILRKIDVLNKDMLTMRADQLGFETRLDKLEPTNVS